MSNRQSEDVDALFAHWLALPKEGLVPHVRDFLDRPEPRFQQDVALIECLGAGELRMRLFGTRRVQAYGDDLTGINPLDGFAPHLRKRTARAAYDVIIHPCGYRCLRKVRSVMGRVFPVESISLPLINDPDRSPMVLNYHAFEDYMAPEETTTEIIGIEHARWVDIGAGVPGHPADPTSE